MPRSGWIVPAAIACVAAAAGACMNRERPAAVPSLFLNPDSVPIGGPIDVTLSFLIPRDAPPFPDDCRVLLRILFDDGTVMGSYDHDPPRPTRQWRAGTTITYTRRIFAPDVPYVGDAPIVAGLYSASGKRLLLKGRDAGDRTYAVGTLKLNAKRILLVHRDGWDRPESLPHEPEWRWIGSAASMTLHNPRRDAVLHLRLDGNPAAFETPQRVSVLIAGRIVHTFDVSTPAVTDHEIPVRAADFGTDLETTLTLEVDKTFVPAQTGPGTDRRNLGVRVYNVFLAPRSAQ